MRLLTAIPRALLLSATTPHLCVAMPTTTSSQGQESLSTRAEEAPQFYNGAGHRGADPFVLYDSSSGRYYAYSTEGADQGFHFAIYSSPDLSTWHKHPGGALKACNDGVEDGQACWARDWFWAPETYHNEETGWYFFFFAARLRTDITKDHFRYSAFEEPSKLGIAVSRSPTGPFREIQPEPIDYYPYDPDYYDVNLIMDEKQMLPPKTLEEGQKAPKGTYIPTIDPNVFFDNDGRIYLYTSRNAYRNWNWDKDLGKYIEESNIIAVELERDWWDDPTATTMPKVVASQIDLHAKNAPDLPENIESYNGTGEIGQPPRKDGWKTVLLYGADPQEWENHHVDDYNQTNGAKKDRRWSEGSTLLTRPDAKTGKPVYLLTFSANNFEASNYGVGFATAESPLGPFRKSSNNPVLSQAPDGEIPVYSTGHGCVVASPPSGNRKVGAQDVTRETLEGTELFYIHHARNDTSNSRSIYSTRMTLDATAISYGSNDAISIHLTPLDQPVPKETYPIQLEAKRTGSGVRVHVSSKTGGPFDITEGSNRVVGLPGSIAATSITESDGEDGVYLLGFGGASLEEIAYQRLGVDGSWTTIVKKKPTCK